jgi:hypothetical protein
MNAYKIIRNSIYLCLILWLVSALSSCGSVHKTAHIDYSKTDTAATTHTDVSDKAKENSVTVHSEDKDSKTETVINFDDTTAFGDYKPSTDPPKSSDYGTIDLGYSKGNDNKIPAVIIHPDGSISVNVKPKNIHTTKTEKAKVKDTVTTERQHDIQKKQDTNIKATHTTKVVDTTKKKTGLTIGAKIMLLVMCAGGLYLLFIAWKRKKLANLLKLNNTNMKNIILFALCATLLMSCGGAGHLPTDNVSWGQAFGHVSHSFWYWFFAVITFIVLAVNFYFSLESYAKGEIDGGQFALRLIVCLVIFAFAFLFRPCEVAANTTVEQAARNHWIGY